MANEPIYNVASFESKGKLTSAQTVVETRLLPMGGITISKVLSYSAKESLQLTDVFTGEARLSGRVSFRVLFLDGEGVGRSVEAAAEFTDKISDDSISNGRPQIMSRILDIDVISVASDEIKLAAIVETDLFDNVALRTKYLQSAGDNVYMRDEKTRFMRLVAKAEDTISISDEIKAEGERILLVESKVIPIKQSAGRDCVVLEGEIISSIITEGDGNIYNYRVKTPFSNESAADGVSEGCMVDCFATVAKTNASLIIGEEDGAVSLEHEISLCAYAYVEDEINTITDAFSVSNELSVTSAEVPVSILKTCKTVFERVEGSVTLNADMPIADKVLASAADRLNLANVYIKNDRLVLEGTVTSSVIYFSAETGSKNSVDIELPFSITTSENIGGEIVSAYGEVAELNAKLRRGNEIDIKAEIAVTICSAEKSVARMITDLQIGGALEIPSAAISLHIAKPKESLWEVAKALKTTPELILLQNPDLSFPLAGGERIIIYRHLKK